MLEAMLSPYPSTEPTTPALEEGTADNEVVIAGIKQWQARILAAKRKWKDDFERMRMNMRFASGLQWPGQTKMDDERYINNVVLRLINQKVATIYAKNPTAVATRRTRMDYQIWDEQIESITSAIMQGQMFIEAGVPLPVELNALLSDYDQGQTRKALVQKVCDTLKIVYQYQVDSHKPDYKEQMKAAVRRTCTCCVAFCRLIFCQDSESYSQPSSVDAKSTTTDRVGRIKAIITDMQNGEISDTDARLSTLRSLLMSLGGTDENPQGETALPERLEFDFPQATSVIVDPRCRSLKGFVGARWIAHEFILPVEEVNSIFNVDVKVGGSGDAFATEVAKSGTEAQVVGLGTTQGDSFTKGLISLYEVFDYTTKTRFFICEGWKEYVLEPESVFPSVNGFWHTFALTFNDVEAETDEGVDDNIPRASIYPPSDVQIVKHPQKEWNRTRQALREHRNANAPKYLTRKGYLTDEDVRKLQNAEPNSVIQLEGVPADQPLDKFIIPMIMSPIDPRLYDTEPLQQDLMLGGGVQQANIGPAQPNVTATVGTIAEQSRLDVSSSNVDDLDFFLTQIASAGGEMLLQAMSKEMVMRIAGPGAVWPDSPESRQDFLNEILLTIQAASSGRPNKAIDVSNWRDLVPILQAAGANPVGLVEETAKRLDDNMDPTKFFPLTPPQGSLSPGEDQGEGEPSPESSATDSAPQDESQESSPPIPLVAG